MSLEKIKDKQSLEKIREKSDRDFWTKWAIGTINKPCFSSLLQWLLHDAFQC